MRSATLHAPKQSVLSRLWARIEPERFYKRRKVQNHMWGYGAVVGFFGFLSLFARDAYAAGSVNPMAWDNATWLAFFTTLGLIAKTIDTHIKVRRDAKQRNGARIPLADASQFLTRVEFEEHVSRQEDRDGLAWAAVDGLRAEFAQFRLDQALGQDRQMARFDAMAAGQREVKDIVLRALSQREGK